MEGYLSFIHVINWAAMENQVNQYTPTRLVLSKVEGACTEMPKWARLQFIGGFEKPPYFFEEGVIN